MLEAIFTLIGTVMGTVLGFFLSEWAQSRRENREQKRRSSAIRTLISLEMNTNLKDLESFWIEVNKTEESAANEKQIKIQFARRILNLAFPDMSQDAFKSQMTQLPLAVNSQLLSKIFQFYDRITRLQALREALDIAAREQRLDQSLVDQSNSIPAAAKIMFLSQRFDNSAPAIGEEFGKVISQLMSDGNPLEFDG